jgi:hypothetical protein
MPIRAGGVNQLALTLLLLGCEGRPPHSGEDVTFGGTLQSSPVQLVAVSSDHAELVALLREQGRIVMLEPAGVSDLKAPAGCTSPVVLGVGPLGDGGDGLLVLDSACGGWVAVRDANDGWTARSWDDYFPQLAPADQVFLEDLDGDGDPDLASATSAWVSGFVRRGEQQWKPFENVLAPPLANRAMAKNVAITATWQNRRALVVQKPGELQLLFVGSDNPATALPQTDLELLKPFDGFDQLTALPSREACGIFALGAGFFSDVYRAPKPLVGLALGTDTFVATRVPTAQQHIIALATTVGAHGEFVGLIEGANDGFYFELLERLGCEFQSRVLARIEFHVNGIVPLPESAEQLAASSGEFLLGAEVDGALLFSHFDGKNLRRFRIDPKSGWSVDEATEHY